MAFLIRASEQFIYPVSAVRDGIVFPSTENVLVFGRPKSVNAINEALKKDKKIILLMQKNSSLDSPKKEDLYQVGVLGRIEKTAQGDKGEINALVKGEKKMKILSFTREIDWYEAKAEEIKEENVDDEESKAMVRYLSSQIKRAINLGKTVDFVFLMNILNTASSLDFSNQIAVVLDLKPEERQQLLEENNVKERLKKEVDYMNKEIKVLEIEFSLSSKTQKKFERGMKESILREKMKTIEEELELAKLFPFKISIEQGRSILVVYKEDWDKRYGKSCIGFHINPYNFDSSDEKDLFKYLRGVLDKDEAIVDVYFTGGATDPTHNDFYFEYYSPEKKRIARYFPDFLIETTKGRYLVVEVKKNTEKLTYEQNKKQYTGKIEELFDEVFAKEIGFREFQQANKNFEYRLIFDASLQKRQQELLEAIRRI